MHDSYFGFNTTQKRTLIGLLNNAVSAEDSRPHVEDFQVFVSQSSGSDQNSGGGSTPVQTLEQAVRLANAVRSDIKRIIIIDGVFDGRTFLTSMTRVDSEDRYAVAIVGSDPSMATLQRLVIPSGVTAFITSVTLDGVSPASGGGNVALSVSGVVGLQGPVTVQNGYYGIGMYADPYHATQGLTIAGAVTFTGNIRTAIFNSAHTYLKIEEDSVIDVSGLSSLQYGFLYLLSGHVSIHPSVTFVGNPVAEKALIMGASVTVVARGGGANYLPGTLPVSNIGGGLYFANTGLL